MFVAALFAAEAAVFDAADAPAEALAPALEEKNTDGVPLSEGVGEAKLKTTVPVPVTEREVEETVKELTGALACAHWSSKATSSA